MFGRLVLSFVTHVSVQPYGLLGLIPLRFPFYTFYGYFQGTSLCHFPYGVFVSDFVAWLCVTRRERVCWSR